MIAFMSLCGCEAQRLCGRPPVVFQFFSKFIPTPKPTFMFFKQRIAFLFVMATLAACGDNKSADTTSTTETTTQQEAAPETKSQSDKAPTAAVHVVVTGGPHAGTYDAVCKTACCSYEIAGEKIFGNQYSETGKNANELSSVQLVVEDVAGNKTTNEFLMTVSFGD